MLNPTMTTRGQHGGRREGAGRKSIFGATAIAKPFAMDFTPAGRAALAALVKRTGLSRNAAIACLALAHADALVFLDDDTPFPDKARAVLSIRVPPAAGAKLAAARVRTGHSYSDIGEALVRWYGKTSTFAGHVTTAAATAAPAAAHRTRRTGRPAPRRARPR